jgi:tRNA A37 threonylcarbamoyladenosine modification protein TsaB
VVIDAQRGEFYLATHEITVNTHQTTSDLRIVTLPELEAVAAAGGVLVGPEVTKWFPAGRVILPDAATLARLAAAREDFVPGEALEPIYLRATSFVKAPPARNL